MGQIWYFLNVSRKMRLGGGRKLGEFFFSEFNNVYDALRFPCLPVEIDEWLSRGSITFQPGPLGKLSVELLDMIFEEVIQIQTVSSKLVYEPPLYDVVMLSVTCKRMLSIGKNYILRLYQEFALNYRNRLICIGEYSRDLPPNLLTAAETKEIEDWQNEQTEPYTETDPVPFTQFAYERYQDTYGPHDVQATHRYMLMQKYPRELMATKNFKDPLELQMMTILLGIYPLPPFPKGSNILCNLTKSEFVREDTLVVLEDKWSRVTLVHALLSQICWSTSDDFAIDVRSEKHSKTLSRGPWAGDRFHIVSEGKMPAPRRGTAWKDVTNEVNEILRYLWKVEYGTDPGTEYTREPSPWLNRYNLYSHLYRY